MLVGLVCIVACAWSDPGGLPLAQVAIANNAFIAARDNDKVPATAKRVVPDKPMTFDLPASAARLDQVRPVSTTTIVRSSRSEDATLLRDQWNSGITLPEVTSDAGGSYAVQDTFNREPKPRRRGSPLAAAFVLRLDGQADSPAFSVGGGGVAAAMWRAIPR